MESEKKQSEAIDPKKIIVTSGSCFTCGGDSMEVYHQNFPEMRVNGASLTQAIERLVNRLTSSLDAVSDPLHREPVRLALADARAFLRKEKAANTLPDQ